MKMALRWGVLASTCLLLSSCNQITSLFGVTAQEQTQIQSIKAMKTYLVPATNKPLNLFLRTWGFISDFDLPTEYGIELSNFISMLPFTGAGDVANRATPLINAQTKEFQYIRDTTSQTEFQFTAASNSTTNTPHAYKIALNKSRLGPTGTFSVTTTGSSWKFHEGTAPTTGRYGYGCYSAAPQSVSIAMNGTVSGKTVAVSASMTQFSQLVPTLGTFGIQLPDITFKADSVRFSSQGSVTMSGTLGIGPATDGNVFEGDISYNGGTIEGNLNNPKHNYTVTFNYDGSILQAEFKGNGNTTRNIAVIDYDEESQRQVIRYVDGGVEEFPLKVTK